MTLAEKILADAIANLGVHETGDNSGPSVDVYLHFVSLPTGQPWCAAFVSYRAAAAAEELGLTVELPRTGSSSEMFRWFLKRRRITSRPEPGMAGFLRGGPTGHRHTFLVERVGDFTVGSIDANEGNRVERATHSIANCDFGMWTG